MTDKPDDFGIYDWLDVMAHQGKKRECPECHEDDVKFSEHDRNYSGVDFSVHCCDPDCRHTDKGMNNDMERIVNEWHTKT